MIAQEPESVARKRLLKLIDERVGTPVCAQTDPDEWFPEVGQYKSTAMELCRSCPVIRECGDFAIWYFQDYGIWGGMSARERDLIRQKMRIRRRPGDRQGLDQFVEHSQSPSSNFQQSEQQPECLEVDEQHHQSEFQE
jgi:WhiB family redox-sensing transcriptional regulator